MVTNPSTIVIGETFRAQTCVAAESVSFYLRGGAGSVITITAAPDGDNWAGSSPTDSWSTGIYVVEAWAVNAVVCGETIPSYLVGRSRLEVKPSAKNGGAGFNPLTLYEQIVAAIEGHLASNGQDPTWKRYKINNREMERYDASELIRLLGYYKNLAAIERRRLRGGPILGPDIRLRF